MKKKVTMTTNKVQHMKDSIARAKKKGYHFNPILLWTML